MKAAEIPGHQQDVPAVIAIQHHHNDIGRNQNHGATSHNPRATRLIHQNQVRFGDVLLGRGRPLQNHPGNFEFRQLVTRNIQAYEVASKSQKIRLAETLVRSIHQKGGRFLKQSSSNNGEWWHEVGAAEAHEKVAYTFRTVRKKQKPLLPSNKIDPEGTEEHSRGGPELSRLQFSDHTYEKLPDPPPDFNMEKTLSQELMKLTFLHRNKLEEEIHGVLCRAVHETPELVQKALKEFDALLNDTKERNPGKKVLRNILRTSNRSNTGSIESKCYLNDSEVRLRFLRCKYFVVDKAVQHFIEFLEFMSEIFGDFIAERPVRQSDFTASEVKVLRKSRTQFLPFRDRSGRRVFVAVGQANYQFELTERFKTIRFKILMYLHWMASSDVETQRKGFVFHAYMFDEGTIRTNSWEFLRPSLRKESSYNQKKFFRTLPVRMVAFHQYWPDTPVFRCLATLSVHVLDPEIRLATKVYFGGQTEILYKMASYGVPVDALPVTSSKTLKFSNHCAWLDVIEKLQSPGLKKKVVDCPLVGDVVFRIGTTARTNPGNAHYRELVQLYSPDFCLGDNRQKNKITKLVFDDIVSHGGRFLDWWNDEHTWMVIEDPEVALQKIMDTFKRHKHRKSKRDSAWQKLNHALKDAESVGLDDDLEGHKPMSALQQYYSTMHHPLKRLENSKCACFGNGKDNEIHTENTCFGRIFFPTNEQNREIVCGCQAKDPLDPQTQKSANQIQVIPKRTSR